MLYWQKREMKVRIWAVFSSRQWTDVTSRGGVLPQVALVEKYIPWGLAPHKKTSLWGGGEAAGGSYKNTSLGWGQRFLTSFFWKALT